MTTHHDTVVAALRELRIDPATSEYDMHIYIEQLLYRRGLNTRHEVKLARRNRIDFLCGDVGIEVKKGKVLSSRMQEQAARYLAFDTVASLILVIERSVFNMPREINGKPITVISLNKQWGIAL